MEINNIASENKDGGSVLIEAIEAPSVGARGKLSESGQENVKKKRRRGKSKRKIMKPFVKVPWQDRRRSDKLKRINRLRKLPLTKTYAPYNNNQFLMEIHKPEPENSFQIPSARTRDSSFSVDSEENYFYSLPEDEEDFLTKEFSSVYEDAQCERLANLSKTDLLEEYLQLEAKYNVISKRGIRPKIDDEDKDTTATSVYTTSTMEEPTLEDMQRRLKEQEDKIRELTIANEKLRQQNERLRQQACCSSSADSESDSSSTSISCSSASSRGSSPVGQRSELLSSPVHVNEECLDNAPVVANGHTSPLVNGYHDDSAAMASDSEDN